MTKTAARIGVALGSILLAAATVAAQAPKSTDLLTSQQVKELATTANTPADHLKLQKHFLAQAVKYDAEATDHAGLAQGLRQNVHIGRLYPGTTSAQAKHCDGLAGSLKQAAQEARELASEHDRMANAK